MRRRALIAIALGFGAGVSLWSAGSAKHGAELFKNMCAGCHAFDSEKEGPRLRGVFGRPAGAVSGFPYSDGLRKSGLVWDEVSLDKWLADPDRAAPGNDMAFRIEDAGQRADIIAYLKTLTRKEQ